MTDTNPAPSEPFARFRVETERMPDGRSIHYYDWPADEPSREPDRAERATEVDGGAEGDEAPEART